MWRLSGMRRGISGCKLSSVCRYSRALVQHRSSANVARSPDNSWDRSPRAATDRRDLSVAEFSDAMAKPKPSRLFISKFASSFPRVAPQLSNAVVTAHLLKFFPILHFENVQVVRSKPAICALFGENSLRQRDFSVPELLVIGYEASKRNLLTPGARRYIQERVQMSGARQISEFSHSKLCQVTEVFYGQRPDAANQHRVNQELVDTIVPAVIRQVESFTANELILLFSRLSTAGVLHRAVEPSVLNKIGVRVGKLLTEMASVPYEMYVLMQQMVQFQALFAFQREMYVFVSECCPVMPPICWVAAVELLEKMDCLDMLLGYRFLNVLRSSGIVLKDELAADLVDSDDRSACNATLVEEVITPSHGTTTGPLVWHMGRVVRFLLAFKGHGKKSYFFPLVEFFLSEMEHISFESLQASVLVDFLWVVSSVPQSQRVDDWRSKFLNALFVTEPADLSPFKIAYLLYTVKEMEKATLEPRQIAQLVNYLHSSSFAVADPRSLFTLLDAYREAGIHVGSVANMIVQSLVQREKFSANLAACAKSGFSLCHSGVSDELRDQLAPYLEDIAALTVEESKGMKLKTLLHLLWTCAACRAPLPFDAARSAMTLANVKRCPDVLELRTLQQIHSYMLNFFDSGLKPGALEHLIYRIKTQQPKKYFYSSPRTVTEMINRLRDVVGNEVKTDIITPGGDFIPAALLLDKDGSLRPWPPEYRETDRVDARAVKSERQLHPLAVWPVHPEFYSRSVNPLDSSLLPFGFISLVTDCLQASGWKVLAFPMDYRLSARASERDLRVKLQKAGVGLASRPLHHEKKSVWSLLDDFEFGKD